MHARYLALGLLVPVLGFCILFYGGVEGWTRNAASAAIALVGAACLVPVLRGRALLRGDPGLLGLAILAGTAAASAAWSVNRWLTWEHASLVATAGVVYALCAHLPGRRPARAVLAALLVLGLAAALYGLVTTLGGHEVVVQVRKEAYRDSLTGTFINRNHFASFLALLLLAGLGLLAASGRRARLVLAGGLAAGVLALGLTLSRGGILAAGVGLVALLALLGSHGRRGLAAALAVLLLGGTGLLLTNWERLKGRIDESLDPRGEPSAAARVSLWRSTLRAAAARPLLGYGAGTFRSFYPRYREAGISRRVTYAHQEYLELAAEQGLVGTALAALGLGALAVALRRAHGSGGPERPVQAGILAGLAALAAHGLVDFPLKIPAVTYVAAALAGLVVSLGAHRAPPLGARASRLLGALLIALLAGLAWRGIQVARADLELARARAAFDEPDWDASGRAYERALAIDPGNPEAWGGLGHTELNRGKFRRAERDRRMQAALARFRHAAALDPEVGDYNLQIGFTLNFLGDTDGAAREYDEAVAKDPQNANTLSLAGLFYLHRGLFDKGLDLLGRAIRSWPRFFGGKVPEIHGLVKDPGRVLAIIPDDQPFLVFQYAYHLAEVGEWEASGRAFARAQERTGWREDWLVAYSSLVAERDSLKAAQLVYEQVPEAHRSAAVELEGAKLLILTHRLPEALERLEATSRRFPGDPEVVRRLVAYGAHRPGTREALERYRAARGEDGGYEVARAGLALHSRQDLQALEHFERALALEPRNSHARDGVRRVALVLAEAAERDGDCRGAALLRETAALAETWR